MRQKLRQFLQQREKRHMRDTGYIPSAVLVPIYCKDGQYHILFTQRTSNVPYHKGEISFPGGGFDKRDRSLLDTALRESAEEIGLASEDVEILGELDDNITTTSNYVISPFVAFIPYPYPFRVDSKETEQIIEVPIEALMDKSSVTQQTEYLNNQPIVSYSYNYNGKVIHGATARILHHFLDIWTRLAGDMRCGLK